MVRNAQSASIVVYLPNALVYFSFTFYCLDPSFDGYTSVHSSLPGTTCRLFNMFISYPSLEIRMGSLV